VVAFCHFGFSAFLAFDDFPESPANLLKRMAFYFWHFWHAESAFCRIGRSAHKESEMLHSVVTDLSELSKLLEQRNDAILPRKAVEQAACN
jgi:hypothetical protein